MRIPVAALLVATAFGASAVAQTTTTGSPARPDATTSQQSGGQQSVTRPNTDTMGPNGATGSLADVKLEKGANSFTEGEVRSRLDKAGFRDAKDLKKDGDGIWRGTAMREGRTVPVGLDFKGNVAAQ